MVRSTKNDRLKEKIRADIKYSNQTTLENIAETPKPATPAISEQKKQIEILEIGTHFQEDVLVLKIAFKLLPSRTAFSHVTSDLYFDEQKIDSSTFSILQGALATDELEYSSSIYLAGMSEGQRAIRLEMYELWSPNGEKLNKVAKEAIIQYVPVKREDRLIRIPIVKSVAGSGLAVESSSEKELSEQIEGELRRMSFDRRDYW
jgi:hypothetical protein